MRPGSSGKSDRWFVPSLVCLFLAVTAVYGRVIFSHYAYADDFMTLYAVRSPTLSLRIPPFHNVQGRPLGGWIMEAAFRAAWTVGGLGKVRVLCLTLALLCGALLAAEWRRVAPWWIGLGVVTLFLLNPAMTVCIAWPSAGLLGLPSAALALAGGAEWRRAFERGDVRSRRFWFRVAGAGGLGLAALLIYQPAACFFLLPAAVRLLDREDPRGALRAGTWTAGGFTVLCAGYFAAFQIVRPHLAKAEDLVMFRADVVRDVPGRIWFYLTDVLPRAFESWTVFFGAVPGGVALCAAGGLTAVFLVRLARTPGGAFVRWQALLLGPVLFGLASSPLLVVRDNYAPFRTLAVLYGLVAVGLAGGVAEIGGWRSVRRHVPRGALATLWIGLIVADAAAAVRVTGEAFVRRSVREMDLYRQFARLRLADHPREVIVLLPRRQDVPRLSRFAPQHEFGTASSQDAFNFPGLVYFALEEEYRGRPAPGGSPSGAEIVVHKVPTDGTELFPPDLPVIDAARVLEGGSQGGAAPRSGPVTEDAFFGEVQPLTPILRLSRWFGLYETLSPTAITHRELGTLDLAGPGGKDCWFRSEEMGWFWTNPASFPSVYSGERKHWLWYVRGTTQPTEFYDLDAPGRPRVTPR